MQSSAHLSHTTEALRDLLRRTELAGAQRRALLLHTDRLPAAIGKTHHQRLARAALSGLAQADRAQHFELSRGRVAIVWRNRGGQELESTLAALAHLMADLPAGNAVAPGELVSLFDLPDQAPWLLDELAEPAGAATNGAPPPSRVIDTAILSRLEATLAHADLSRFMRWRKVLSLEGAAPALAWEERYIAARDLAANLCPEYRIKAEGWLFQRLTRSFDRRMLTLAATGSALGNSAACALHMNVASILSPEFLRFDESLPAAMRGNITLNLLAADILADPATFLFARNFSRGRGYKLLLRAASPTLLQMLNLDAAAFDFIQLHFTPQLAADPAAIFKTLPLSTKPVLTGLQSPGELDWAKAHNFMLIRGA
jgi:hypothetical protein